ncbi:mandelate racemase/muconate lactonizing enzyme family protein [Aliamphritea spongicola]|uniref:mandelate racemase/muconate lactonizing enzyme family protein n=1 Tax=Aliamphritea spongicola TaxID=707589 RepID=UPI00196B5840|nr:mandelate racemase/muconate lactonizing enzyme family protein [Aliamphritea spongicola]MBN3561603.1 mandelate racemase/muconate lactonizing enzyme family protein [Aliamphritea spongicola]
MKIARIDVFQQDLPYSGGVYRLSGGREYHSFDATFVRITTDTGLEGWGESTPFGATYIAAHALGVRAGIAEMAPQLIGLDPRHVDRVNDAMDGALVGHNHAKTAIDVACWDIFGKATGMPVCDLLGGRTRAAMPIISSIYAGDPDDMRSRIAEHRAQGYRSHSIKVGAAEAEGGPALDAERITASLADRQPGEYFLVDANGGMSVEHALRMIRLLPPGLDIVLEAPCATIRECQSLRARCDIPIIWDELALDETAVTQIVANDLADGIGLKISKNGGLTRGRRQRDICTAAGLTLSVQETTGSDIAFAAIVHLGQTVRPELLRSVLECRDMVSLTTADGNFRVENGLVMAPDEPGLGITPRLDVLGEPVASYG